MTVADKIDEIERRFRSSRLSDQIVEELLDLCRKQAQITAHVASALAVAEPYLKEKYGVSHEDMSKMAYEMLMAATIVEGVLGGKQGL